MRLPAWSFPTVPSSSAYGPKHSHLKKLLTPVDSTDNSSHGEKQLTSENGTDQKHDQPRQPRATSAGTMQAMPVRSIGAVFGQRS